VCRLAGFPNETSTPVSRTSWRRLCCSSVGSVDKVHDGGLISERSAGRPLHYLLWLAGMAGWLQVA